MEVFAMNKLRITQHLIGGFFFLLVISTVFAAKASVKFQNIYIPEECQIQVSVYVSFTALVTGADSLMGGITLSFSKPIDVEISSSTMSSAKVYPTGSRIWDKEKNAIKSTHLMAEGWQEGWDEDAQYFLRLRISPKEVGTFDVYFRATVKDDESGEYVNSVSEGVLDQQGWMTEKLGNMGVGRMPKYFSKYDVMAFRGRRLVHLRKGGMEWATLKDIAPNDYFPSPRRSYIVYYSECSAGFDVGCYNLTDRIEKVFEDKEGKWLGWKSDTEAIFRLRDGSLEIYNTETGAFRPAKKEEAQYGLPDASLSPDKSKHIYVKKGVCWVENMDGTNASPLKVELGLTSSLQTLWSPDGTQILASDGKSAKLLVLGVLK